MKKELRDLHVDGKVSFTKRKEIGSDKEGVLCEISACFRLGDEEETIRIRRFESDSPYDSFYREMVAFKDGMRLAIGKEKLRLCGGIKTFYENQEVDRYAFENLDGTISSIMVELLISRFPRGYAIGIQAQTDAILKG